MIVSYTGTPDVDLLTVTVMDQLRLDSVSIFIIKRTNLIHFQQEDCLLTRTALNNNNKSFLDLGHILDNQVDNK